MLKSLLFAGVLISCAFCLASMAWANEASGLIQKARENILFGRYDAAEEFLRSALAIDPENREAILLLGVSLGRRGSKEASGYLKRALYMDPEDPVANLELGKHFYERGVPGEAADFFERALELSGGEVPAISEAAAGYLKEIRKQDKPAKGLALSALAGLQYDSNVPAFSEDASIALVGKQEDLRTIFNVRAGYGGLDVGPFDTEASYSFYTGIHSDLGQYDSVLHTATIKGATKRSGASLQLLYVYEYATVDGYSYTSAHSFSPSLLIPAGNASSVVLTYRYKDMNAHDIPVSPSHSGRSGASNLLGASMVFQRLPVSLHGSAGYIYEDTGAALDEYAYSGQRVFIKVDHDYTHRDHVSIYTEYYDRDFPHAPPYGRSERRKTVSATLTRKLGARYSLALSYSGIWNDSADRRYEYERAVTGLLLKARY